MKKKKAAEVEACILDSCCHLYCLSSNSDCIVDKQQMTSCS